MFSSWTSHCGEGNEGRRKEGDEGMEGEGEGGEGRMEGEGEGCIRCGG